MQTILVCDDDKQIVEAISIYLAGEGFRLLKAYDGYDALKIMDQEKVDLLIIDVMMPGLDGIRTTLKIREKSSIPIIILSAKGEDNDKILGLNIGADDYITKPFDLNVLLAKISATIRRNYGELKSEENMEATIEKEGLSFYPSRLYFEYAGRKVDLTATESQLFSALLSSYPDAVSRDELFSRAWDEGAYVEENTLNVNVRRLRNKCKEKKIPLEIKSIRGLGYQLKIGGVD